MSRSTRLLTPLSPPESLRFLSTTIDKLPHRRAYVKTLTFHPHLQFSSRDFPKIAYFSDKTSNSLRPHPNPPVMDLHPSGSTDPPPTGEDFVHVENPNPAVDALNDSIVNVDDELREENVAVLEAGGSEAERKELPAELSRSVMVLTCDSAAEGGKCTVYVVGTAHVSQESCRIVQDVVSFLKPQVVFLELCVSRVAVLTPRDLKVPTMGEMIEMWKKNHNMFGILYTWFLAKVAEKLEVFPGSEFCVGYEEAKKCHAKVVLGDRPVQITLLRTWGKMSRWHKAKLIFSLFFQALFLPNAEDLNKVLKEMDDVDMLTLVIQQMSKEFPTLMETLVLERDKYLSSRLLSVASEHTSVVAVVGKGHLQGIKDYWKQPVDMTELLEIPKEKPAPSAMKVLSSLGVAVTGIAIISGIYLSCKK